MGAAMAAPTGSAIENSAVGFVAKPVEVEFIDDIGSKTNLHLNHREKVSLLQSKSTFLCRSGHGRDRLK